MGAVGDWPVVIGLTDGRDSRDDLAELELVQDGGLTGSIETDHEDAHLLLAEEVLGTAGHGENRVAGERGHVKMPFKSAYGGVVWTSSGPSLGVADTGRNLAWPRPSPPPVSAPPPDRPRRRRQAGLERVGTKQ